MKRILFFGLTALVLATSCATPESRIKKNPELFASYPPETQEMIRAGRIGIGFDAGMVVMALGEPDRRYSRQTAGDQLEVWSYTVKEFVPDRQRTNATFSYRDYRGVYRTASDWVWVDVNREIEYERLRVELSRGIVTAIETLER